MPSPEPTPAAGAVTGLADFHLPPGLEPPGFAVATTAGRSWRRARWSGEALAAVAGILARDGAAALRGIPDPELRAAWTATVARFRDPASSERRALDPLLAALTGLSPAGLAAGLETILAGVDGEPAAALLARARPLPRPGPGLVVLAGNLPGLGLQALWPALALRRPVLLKSASREPLLIPAFLGALARRLPALASGVAAATWRGGAEEIEAPLLAAVDRVLAYGDEPALADLARRAPGRLVGQGPKASVALVGADADPALIAPGLARDVALFDQQGCLSLHAVYTSGDAPRLAAALAAALREIARLWPPGPAPLPLAAAVRQLREEAALRGLPHHELALAAGTVIVESDPGFQPSPGLRTVRIHPVPRLAAAVTALTPWQGRLQGATLAGGEAWDQAAAVRALGVSHLALPGELQRVDVGWANGGIDPLEALG